MIEIRQLPKELLTLRILIGAMATGVAVFAIVAAFLAPVDDSPSLREIADLLSFILIALVVALTLTYVIVRTVMLKQLRAKLGELTDDARLSPVVLAYFQLTLIAGAMAESVGLFGVVIILLAGQGIVWIAPLLALMVLGALFPRLDAFRSFAENVTAESIR